MGTNSVRMEPGSSRLARHGHWKVSANSVRQRIARLNSCPLVCIRGFLLPQVRPIKCAIASRTRSLSSTNPDTSVLHLPAIAFESDGAFRRDLERSLHHFSIDRTLGQLA